MDLFHQFGSFSVEELPERLPWPTPKMWWKGLVRWDGVINQDIHRSGVGVCAVYILSRRIKDDMSLQNFVESLGKKRQCFTSAFVCICH